MIYGCSQPRELWFIDFNHVYLLLFYLCCLSLVDFFSSVSKQVITYYDVKYRDIIPLPRVSECCRILFGPLAASVFIASPSRII